MYLSADYPLHKFYQALQETARVVVTAAKNILLPNAKTPPQGINPDAEKKYWKEFCEKYQDVWMRYKKEPERVWACCVAIWTNYCLKRRTQPFNATAATSSEETQDTLINRAVSAREAQVKLANSLLSKGVRKGVFSKFMKETFVSVKENKPGSFVMLSRMFVKLEKGVEYGDAAFKELMTACSFVRKRGAYIRNVRANTDVIVHLDPDTEKPAVVFKNTFAKAYGELMLQVTPDKDNTEKVKAELVKVWKHIIKEIPAGA